MGIKLRLYTGRSKGNEFHSYTNGLSGPLSSKWFTTSVSMVVVCASLLLDSACKRPLDIQKEQLHYGDNVFCLSLYTVRVLNGDVKLNATNP